jgi:hypothetical protein
MSFSITSSNKRANISASKVHFESFHDPNELRKFQERIRRQLMNLHRKPIQNRGQSRIAGESELACKEVPKHNNLVVFRSRDLFITRRTCIADRENPGCLILLDKISGNLRFTEHEGRRIRFCTFRGDKFTWISVNISKILLTARLAFGSYFPSFTVPRIMSSTMSWIFRMTLNVSRSVNFLSGW